MQGTKYSSWAKPFSTVPLTQTRFKENNLTSKIKHDINTFSTDFAAIVHHIHVSIKGCAIILRPYDGNQLKLMSFSSLHTLKGHLPVWRLSHPTTWCPTNKGMQWWWCGFTARAQQKYVFIFTHQALKQDVNTSVYKLSAFLSPPPAAAVRSPPLSRRGASPTSPLCHWPSDNPRGQWNVFWMCSCWEKGDTAPSRHETLFWVNVSVRSGPDSQYDRGFL